MEVAIGASTVTTLLLVIFAIVLVFKGIKVIPQSDVFVIERFGKYTKTLQAGLNFIVPFLDRVAHKISILPPFISLREASMIFKLCFVYY